MPHSRLEPVDTANEKEDSNIILSHAEVCELAKENKLLKDELYRIKEAYNERMRKCENIVM